MSLQLTRLALKPRFATITSRGWQQETRKHSTLYKERRYALGRWHFFFALHIASSSSNIKRASEIAPRCGGCFVTLPVKTASSAIPFNSGSSRIGSENLHFGRLRNAI
jgi:hypothetical protein